MPKHDHGGKLPPDIERVALVGWHVYPASARSRAACFRGATDAASCDLDTIERWARDYPNCNWRVVVGPSGLFGLDCDTPPLHAHDGITALAELARAHGGLPPRPALRSGGGGLALFFSARHGERIIGESGHPAPGIDPRRGRQSQTIPPSIHHATGRPYRWLSPPWEVTPPRAPEWLLRLVAPPPEPARPLVPNISTTDRARRRLNQAIDAVLRAGNGGRNAMLNAQAFAVARHIASGTLGEAEAQSALYAAARHTGLSHSEIKDTLRSAFAAGCRAVR